MANIGFIGLGHMGNPMVRNLLKHGHQLTVYDIGPQALESLVAVGAKGAKSVIEIAKSSEIIITMLQTGKQVSDIYLGETGLINNAKPNTLFIDSSTIDIETSRTIHKKAQNKGSMVDAPVSGGVAGAEAGTITFMVGGSENSFKLAEPILACMGKKIVHAGPDGNGQAAKICNNMMLAIEMIGVCEGFSLAEKLGLDAKKLFEISSNASAQCWSMTSYSPIPDLVANVPSNNDYKPGFMAKMMLKDLKLSQAAAENSSATTPLGAVATELYEMFVNEGYDEMDFSGIIKLIQGGK